MCNPVSKFFYNRRCNKNQNIFQGSPNMLNKLFSPPMSGRLLPKAWETNGSAQ